MRLVDADVLMERLKAMKWFYPDDEVRAEVAVAEAQTIANIPVRADLKEPRLIKRNGLIESDYLIYRVNDILPQEISKDAKSIYNEIVNSPEVDDAYVVGGSYANGAY